MTAELASVLDAVVAVEDLRRLAALTSDGRGAQRVAWTPTWARAREWLLTELAELPVEVDVDAAGNLWAELRGDAGGPVLALGSHLDSVPDGGWLDGALGVVAALAVLRAAAVSGFRAATLRLVDWADEEGARFGHSLLGSSAATGQLDTSSAGALRDAAGVLLTDALAAHGVAVGRMHEAGERLRDLSAFLELHIEQGPVLERQEHALGVPTGSVAIHRMLLTFSGQTSHAGTTPLDERRDAGAAAAQAALAARARAREHAGLATVGSVALEPGVPTAVAGRATLTIDLRHRTDEGLAALGSAIEADVRQIAEEERVGVEAEPLWAFPAVAFDVRLVETISAAAGGGPHLVSGALHDAVAIARSGIPTAMLFVRSIGGISHAAVEDTSEPDLIAALRSFAAGVEAVATDPRWNRN